MLASALVEVVSVRTERRGYVVSLAPVSGAVKSHAHLGAKTPADAAKKPTARDRRARLNSADVFSVDPGHACGARFAETPAGPHRCGTTAASPRGAGRIAGRWTHAVLPVPRLWPQQLQRSGVLNDSLLHRL